MVTHINPSKLKPKPHIRHSSHLSCPTMLLSCLEYGSVKLWFLTIFQNKYIALDSKRLWWMWRTVYISIMPWKTYLHYWSIIEDSTFMGRIPLWPVVHPRKCLRRRSFGDSFVVSLNRQLQKHSSFLWSGTPTLCHWRSRDVTVMATGPSPSHTQTLPFTTWSNHPVRE